ncbi:sulfite exporter TauE/SafE family protein [Rhizobium halophytocola]|uniref:Probable membrane transporter protein n=1 Tax=Rhizobium halophytocola TaxID=735519 RepID=A0ABS4E0V9_9HYPH|nr:sulfite exporter TauE/SafE family protein [Rhizobium halophytocola]MBP1851573.1 putative membrane protein YfcA [Rhizobium halophytocola]
MDQLAIGVLTAVAGAFRGVTGFGYALAAALGLAALGFAPSASVPFILVNDLMLTAFILMDRKHGSVDWNAARLLLAAGIAGALCGNLIAHRLDPDIGRLMVALIVMLAAGIAMIRQPPAWLARPSLGLVIGFVVGVFLSAFAVGGPLVAAWLLAGGTQRPHIRGTLAVFFGVVDLFALASRLLTGHSDPNLMSLLAVYCPLTLLGFAAGHLLSRRLPASVWQRVCVGGLVLVAAVGLIEAVHAFTVI